MTFKAKSERILKKIKYEDNDVIIATQANTCMDGFTNLWWSRSARCSWHTLKGARVPCIIGFWYLKKIWKRKSLLTENNISYVVISGGCMSKIQSLDVCLNRPFKTYICGAWEEYMVKQAWQSTGASSIPMPSRTEIIQWVVAANNCLSSQEDMVRKSSSYMESVTTFMVVRITWLEFLPSCQFWDSIRPRWMTQIHFRARIVPLMKTAKKKKQMKKLIQTSLSFVMGKYIVVLT